MNRLSSNNYFIKKIKRIFFPFYNSTEIKKLFGALEKNKDKNEKVLMFVGGCVRNFLNNEKVDDIDLATTLTPNEIIKKLKSTDIKVIETGIEHGSLTLLVNESKFEITTLREDIITDGRHAKINFTNDWKLDSERRDFTINAIYMDQKGKIFDPQSGVEDLKKKIVKFIGDPEKRIKEDYLRIIRFIRFSLKYDSLILNDSEINAINLNLDGIKNLSKERILNELLKIVDITSFDNILKNEKLKNIFSVIFPEFKYFDSLKKLKFIQNDKTLVFDNSIILGVLLIDDTDNHEYFSHKYKVSNNLKNQLNLLAKNYYKSLSDRNFFKKNIKKNIYFLGKNLMKKILIFTFLKNKKFDYPELTKLLKEIEKIHVPKFPYSGKYLIEKGFLEGKKIGIVLSEIEKVWVESNFHLTDEKIAQIIKKTKN